MKFNMTVFGLLAVLFIGSACIQDEEKNNPAPIAPVTATPSPVAVAPTPAPASNSGNQDVLAKLNGAPITNDEVYDRVKDRLQKIESQIYDIKKSGLDDIIEEKLLEAEASKRRMSVDELLKEEVDKKIEEPTQSEIDTFYNIYKGRYQNKPLSEIKPDLVKQIKSTKKNSAYVKFIGDLKKSAKLEVFMTRPRIAVSTDTAQVQGNPGAPITIVEFSDFQCPFCKKTRATLQQIMDTYKGKVYYAFRNFPLSFHKQARKAAIAAECAGDQKKYWEYSAILWEKQGAQDPDQLKEYAKDLGLNEKKFVECLASDKYEDKIDKDIQDGSKAGVSGTPAYFINGIFVSGAQPFEKFQEIIEDELQGK